MTDCTTLPITTRLGSFAIAVLCTLAILAGVDHLAQSDAGAPQLAHAASSSRG